ncbi:MAG: hypothetical protein Q9220_000410 [cf. Caloplaca sp. 1 TL-2023]
MHNIACPTEWAAAAPIVYCPSVALAKAAILLFYLRLSPVKSFRYSVYATLFVVIGYMVAVDLATFFQCRPIRKLWTPAVEGTCIHVYDLYLANSILNVITDFMVLLVPLPMLRSLQVGKKQKWIIAGLFAVGSLTCILSAVRTYFIAIILKIPLDTPWHVPTSTTLIIAETNLSVICGCVMVLRPFIRRHLPFLIGGDTRRSPGAAIYDGYPRSRTDTKITSSGNPKSNISGSRGGGVKGWLAGGRRPRTDTDSTLADRGDMELGPVGWPLESGRENKKRDARSESEEHIMEAPTAGGGIVKTVKVDVR